MRATLSKVVPETQNILLGTIVRAAPTPQPSSAQKPAVARECAGLFDHLRVIADEGMVGVDDDAVPGAFKAGVGQFHGAVMGMPGAVKQVYVGNEGGYDFAGMARHIGQQDLARNVFGGTSRGHGGHDSRVINQPVDQNPALGQLEGLDI